MGGYVHSESQLAVIAPDLVGRWHGSPDEAERCECSAELRGPVLDVLRTLLGDHQERDAVMASFGELVARNTELERRFAHNGTRYKPSEQVSKAQFVLSSMLKRRQVGPMPDGTPRRTEPEPPDRPASASNEPRMSSGATNTRTVG